MAGIQSLGIELQPRDFALLRGLFESRVMTLSHISTLYFDEKREMAKKRVQKLKAAKLVRERPRHFTEPSVLFLARRGLEVLRDNGHLTAYPSTALADLERRAQVSALTLKHELEVMDVKAAMLPAARSLPHLKVEEFSTWPALYQFKACRPGGEQVTVRPDGLIRIREEEADGGLSEHTFFLEVDRSTETLEVLGQRCHCYLDYYRTGGLALRNGATRERYKEFPFRVIIVCKSAERRDNIGKRLLQNVPPIGTQVWLATAADVLTAPLGMIWSKPNDYRGTSAGPRAALLGPEYVTIYASAQEQSPR